MRCSSFSNSPGKRKSEEGEDGQADGIKRHKVLPMALPNGAASSSPRDGSGLPYSRNAPDHWEGLPRRELILLILQTLDALGYRNAMDVLESESGMVLEGVDVKSLHESVLKGNWRGVREALSKLNFQDPVGQACHFLVLEQKYLELLYDKQIFDALDCLRSELADACFDAESTDRLHKCSSYLMCQDPDDLQGRAEWTYKGSRELLWQRMVDLIPPEVVVPPRRLAVLLHQAWKLQEMHCVYHNRNTSSFSLLQDHTCPQGTLPTHCVATLDEHTDEVWFVAISHNGRYIASSSKDKTVIIWECQGTAFTKVQHLIGHSDASSFIAWSPDDAHIATASNDKTVRVWASDTAKCVRVITKHTESVASVCWLQDNERFVSAGIDKCIYMWNLNDPTEEQQWMFSSRIQDVAVTSDGKKMLVVTSEKSIKVIDLHSKRELFSLPESDPVTSVTVSSIADQVLVNISHQTPVIRLWDLTERRIVQRYRGHYQGRFVVRSCFGGPQETYVISGSEDTQVYIWHRHFGSLLEVLQGHAATVNCIAWPPNSPWMLTASDDQTLRVWSTKPTIEATLGLKPLPPAAMDLLNGSSGAAAASASSRGLQQANGTADHGSPPHLSNGTSR
mmetsp:Transcript_35390/g.87958  ORF Transcript_35390/g.87958 Transcript_35390/m.87958 type:complete len:620 (-) Transcript_35390:32-1891(-)